MLKVKLINIGNKLLKCEATVIEEKHMLEIRTRNLCHTY